MTAQELTVAYEIVKMLYREVLREAAAKSVQDSETKIDDFLLKVCDVMFGHDENKP